MMLVHPDAYSSNQEAKQPKGGAYADMLATAQFSHRPTGGAGGSKCCEELDELTGPDGFNMSGDVQESVPPRATKKGHSSRLMDATASNPLVKWTLPSSEIEWTVTDQDGVVLTGLLIKSSGLMDATASNSMVNEHTIGEHCGRIDSQEQRILIRVGDISSSGSKSKDTQIRVKDQTYNQDITGRRLNLI
eukprot:GHVT01003420.1.p1 GENE.GHVT01003420.1~~GHVT01003420.1.p1  ORF type:complete len:207 (+),score=8.32 GHVT01003420.1:53-622(+)